MADCCYLVGNLSGLPEGFISIEVRLGTQVFTTADGESFLGAAVGQLTATAYGSATGELPCPGRAGVQYDWMQRYDCINDIVHFIPIGKDKAFMEGDVTSEISISNIVASNTMLSASASSGPHTIYMQATHHQGWGFSYTGVPLSVSDRYTDHQSTYDIYLPDTIDRLYIVSFNWQHTAPQPAIVQYSYAFSYSIDT